MVRLYALAAGRDYRDPRTVHSEKTAEQIVKGLSRFHILDMTQAEYANLSPTDKAVAKKQSGFLIGGNFGGFKTKADCKYRSLITLDLDALTPETAAQCIRILQERGNRAVIYSTASHRPDAPRLRVFVFLASDVAPSQYGPLVQFYANLLPAGVISSETYKPSQLMYRPQRCRDGEQIFIEIPGEPLDPEPILAIQPPQTTPERKAEATPAWDKPGIVGAVGRRYGADLDRAIAELDLPYRRSAPGPTVAYGEDRYSYTKGAGADGAIWYPQDGHLYSHHGTDPAREQNATIFDLWRLHHSDTTQDTPEQPIQQRPSHKAAEAWFVRRFPEMLAEIRLPVSVDELDVLEPAIEPAKNEPNPFVVQTAAAFASRPRIPWRIKNMMPGKGVLGVLYGASGAGKSFVAWDMACAMELGVPWHGRKTLKSRNVYVVAEGAGGFPTRILAYAKKYGVNPGQLPGIIPAAPNLMNPSDVAQLAKAIKAYGHVDVVWMDTYSAMTPGSDENAGKDVGLALGHCGVISNHTGASIVLVHHSGKDATKGARGWSGLRAAVDMELEVKRVGDLRILTQTKSKDGRDGDQFPFVLRDMVLGLDEDGEDVTSCIVEPVEVEHRPAKGEERKRLTTDQQAIYDEIVTRMAGSPIDTEEAYNIGIALKLKDLPGASARQTREFAGKQIREIVRKKWLHWHHDKAQLFTSPAIVVDDAAFEDAE